MSTFGNIPWDGPAIMLVDLDAFFASVEQLDHPGWQGQAVIVGESPDKRGVVAAASYEARVFGVHSAMPSAIAHRLCPDAIWTTGNYDRYREMSDRVMKILHAETPFVQQISIDEAFVDISPTEHNTEHPLKIARRIQEKIADLGISASIGIGTSKTVAKIASEAEKPCGLTAVYPGREKSFLSPLPICALSGIGSASEKILHQNGIETLGQLAEMDRNRLVDLFGKNGITMHIRAQGGDDSPVEVGTNVKSVSNELSFSHDLTSEEEIRSALRSIASKVGRRLRLKNLKGNTLSLKIRYDDRSIRQAQKRLPVPSADDLFLLPYLFKLLEKLWTPGIPVRLLGVAVSGFEYEEAQQYTLFDIDDKELERYHHTELLENEDDRANLLEASDKIKDRFGEKSLRFGSDILTDQKLTGTGSKNLNYYQ